MLPPSRAKCHLELLRRVYEAQRLWSALLSQGTPRVDQEVAEGLPEGAVGDVSWHQATNQLTNRPTNQLSNSATRQPTKQLSNQLISVEAIWE